MLAFYPVDVWKTSLQAGVSQNDSLVQSKYSSYRRSIASQQGNRGSKTHTTSAITKLLLTAFSAVINTSITLPLDTISSRIQAGTTDRENGSGKKKTLERHRNTTIAKAEGTTAEIHYQSSALHRFADRSSCVSSSEDEEYHSANDEEVDDECPTDQKHLQQLYIKSPEKFKFSFSTNLRDEAFATNPNILPMSGSNNLQQRLASISSLWNGLLPAVLLCSNPAIQYTLYDTIKSALLLRRHSSRAQDQNSTQLSSLSMRESFISGMVSKFFATTVTYPLIRAKVLLMVSPPDTLHSGHSPVAYESTTSLCNGNTTKRKTSLVAPTHTPNRHSRSLPLLLLYIFRKDGIRGIYQGCSLQLLHTVLKSALLMMVRERITYGTQRFFCVEDTC
eukprot:CCRYP_018615-RA/>CCRYP_018615-RA protein AED:0.36 eAED:0.37 QI:0/0/0/1/0/0/3/0/390